MSGRPPQSRTYRFRSPPQSRYAPFERATDGVVIDLDDFISRIDGQARATRNGPIEMHRKPQRTVCNNGHPMTGDNRMPGGQCRACKNARERERHRQRDRREYVRDYRAKRPENGRPLKEAA